ncbi:MAG: FUSC family protein, partial [Acidobacteriota bacterium]
ARHVSLDHGYWVPMTALLVLKPDFHQTLARVTMRIAGTLVGAALATLIAALMRPQPVVLALLVAVFATLCYCLLHVNYAAYSTCITIYVVFLLAMAGLPEIGMVAYRSLNTILGGAFALLVYALPPVQSRQRQ